MVMADVAASDEDLGQEEEIVEKSKEIGELQRRL
jgi:hypothetical protein